MKLATLGVDDRDAEERDVEKPRSLLRPLGQSLLDLETGECQAAELPQCGQATLGQAFLWHRAQDHDEPVSPEEVERRLCGMLLARSGRDTDEKARRFGRWEGGLSGC